MFEWLRGSKARWEKQEKKNTHFIDSHNGMAVELTGLEDRFERLEKRLEQLSERLNDYVCNEGSKEKE